MAINSSYVRGIDQVMKKLNEAIREIEGASLKGLIRGSIIIRRSMDKSYPKIPVDQGNLRASFFSVTSDGKDRSREMSPVETGKFKGENAGELTAQYSSAKSSARSFGPAGMPFVVMGFAANYAAVVHEKRNVKNWNRPNSGPKFFQAHIDKNRQDFLDMVKKEATFK